MSTTAGIAAAIAVAGALIAAALLPSRPRSETTAPAAALPEGAAASAPGPGAVPPAFSGLTYDGKPVSLADYAGKPVWLTFGASWCPDCRNEAADVEATYEANKAKGLNVVAVFISEPSVDL